MILLIYPYIRLTAKSVFLAQALTFPVLQALTFPALYVFTLSALPVCLIATCHDDSLNLLRAIAHLELSVTSCH